MNIDNLLASLKRAVPLFERRPLDGDCALSTPADRVDRLTQLLGIDSRQAEELLASDQILEGDNTRWINELLVVQESTNGAGEHALFDSFVDHLRQCACERLRTKSVSIRNCFSDDPVTLVEAVLDARLTLLRDKLSIAWSVLVTRDNDAAICDINTPVAFRLVAILLSQWETVCGRAFESFVSFRSEVMTALSSEIMCVSSYPDHEIITIEELHFHSSDRSVSYIDRSVLPEVLVYDLLDTLEHTFENQHLPMSGVAADDLCGWRVLEHSDCIEHELRTEVYFRRLGRLLAVLLVVGAGEVYPDDFIASGEYPTLMRAPRLCLPNIFANGRNSEECFAATARNLNWLISHPGVRPVLWHEAIPVSWDTVQEAFTASWSYLLLHSSNIADRCSQLKTEITLRRPSVYHSLLELSLQPDSLHSVNCQSEVFERLTGITQVLPDATAFFVSEYKALSNGQLPRFWQQQSDGSIVFENNPLAITYVGGAEILRDALATLNPTTLVASMVNAFRSDGKASPFMVSSPPDRFTHQRSALGATCRVIATTLDQTLINDDIEDALSDIGKLSHSLMLSYLSLAIRDVTLKRRCVERRKQVDDILTRILMRRRSRAHKTLFLLSHLFVFLRDSVSLEQLRSLLLEEPVDTELASCLPDEYAPTISVLLAVFHATSDPALLKRALAYEMPLSRKLLQASGPVNPSSSVIWTELLCLLQLRAYGGLRTLPAVERFQAVAQRTYLQASDVDIKQNISLIAFVYGNVHLSLTPCGRTDRQFHLFLDRLVYLSEDLELRDLILLLAALQQLSDLHGTRIQAVLARLIRRTLQGVRDVVKRLTTNKMHIDRLDERHYLTSLVLCASYVVSPTRIPLVALNFLPVLQ